MQQNTLINDIEKVYEHFKSNNIKEFAKTRFQEEFSAYTEDEAIIKNAIGCKINAPCDKKLSYIYQIATIIDACYSTQVRRFNNLYYICNLLSKKQKIFKNLTKQINEESLVQPIKELVNEILEDEKVEKKPFSFITKYFALHRKRYNEKLSPLPIYDRYVQMYLDSYYKDKSKKKTFTKGQYNYENFYLDMKSICDDLVIDFDQLDNKIWFTAKSLQFLIGKNSKKDFIDEIINKDFKKIDNNDSCDYKYFIRLLNDIKSNLKANSDN